MMATTRSSRRRCLQASAGLAGAAVLGACSRSSGPGASGADALPDLAAWSLADDIVGRVKAPTFADREFPITRFGAVGDGSTLGTASIAAAVAACSKSGGGHVVVPEGTYLTGAITLLSDVDLHLEAGATLRFSTDPADYPLV